MQMLAPFDESASVAGEIPGESQVETETAFEAIRMRALRRKARRISAYARFNVEALTGLAIAVESDIAGLQH